MRINVLSAVVLCVLVLSCTNDRKNKDKSGDIISTITDKDDKTMKTKEFVGDFDEIDVSSAIDAEIVKSDHEKVVISAPAYLMNDLKVSFSNGKLVIAYSQGIRVINESRVKATIYAKDFTKLEASGASTINVKDKFTQEKVTVEGSGAAEITGNLEANDFNIDMSGASSLKGTVWAINLNIQAASSSEVTIDGKAKNAKIEASSAADVSAEKVVVENAVLDASSSADISLAVITSIDAEASSASEIKIIKKGDVKILRKEESSAGSVTIQ